MKDHSWINAELGRSGDAPCQELGALESDGDRSLLRSVAVAEFAGCDDCATGIHGAGPHNREQPN
jgi:hypothetical protein